MAPRVLLFLLLTAVPGTWPSTGFSQQQVKAGRQETEPRWGRGGLRAGERDRPHTSSI